MRAARLGGTTHWELAVRRGPSTKRDPYPSTINDEEWAFVAPYLSLCREDARQRAYPARQVYNALRWLVRTGCQWRYLPNDFPPWPVVYQQTQRCRLCTRTPSANRFETPAKRRRP